MNKENAEKLMKHLVASLRELEDAEAVAETIDDNDEKIKIIKGLLLAFGEIEDGPIHNIVSEYPDLNPFSDFKLKR